ncbi:hypothetical protein ABZ357_35880 [Streptomyces sp. NPDC005917]|uniref:hypothetical protein n=1 Tax=unclassified Streptomyces TaxID=2593676 RepID=UPI0033C6F34E
MEGVRLGAGLSFDRRVVVLVEIADDSNEIALAEELFTANMWPVRPAEERERVGCPPGRTARVVEVRLPGSRDGAIERALGHVDRLAVAASLKMWARDAVLLEHEPEPYTAWRVRTTSGPAHPGRVIRAAEHRGRGGALADLRARVLAGHSDGSSRVTLDPARASADVRANVILVNIGNGLAFSAAALALEAHGAWQFCGWFVTLLFGAAWLVAGIRAALRGSPARRAVIWALPLASPLLLPLVTWIGTLVQDRYIGTFGIPPDSVHIGATDRLWAGALPVLGIVGCSAFGVASAGWNRRVHAHPTGLDVSRIVSAASIGLLIGVFVAFVPFLVIKHPLAALDAESSVAHYQQPSSYYGLRPTLVCVKPVEAVAHPERGLPGAAYGGAVPLTWPVLTFGPDGDRIWLWDSHTENALNMALADATFVPFDDDYSDNHNCP